MWVARKEILTTQADLAPGMRGGLWARLEERSSVSVEFIADDAAALFSVEGESSMYTVDYALKQPWRIGLILRHILQTLVSMKKQIWPDTA